MLLVRKQIWTPDSMVVFPLMQKLQTNQGEDIWGGKQVISKADNLLLWSSLSKVSVTGAQKPPNEGLAFLRVNCETKQMRRNFRSYLTAHGWLSGCYIRSIYPTNTSQIIMCHRSTTKIICFCFPCSSIKKLIDSY